MSKDARKHDGLFNPFPGLRPFRQDEYHLFFGREGQSKSVLKSLKANNFVAVIGASGTGKSSLIYCGVIPELLSGQEKNWLVVSMRPGSNPLMNLINSIKELQDIEISDDEVEKILSGEINLQDWIKTNIQDKQPLLIVVDQFEEIFRFNKTDGSDKTSTTIDRFLNLIYSGCNQKNNPLRVVLTMRSDFIGECSVYQELTDLINSSNYLIPQMTRDDFRKAIEGPVEVGGASIDGALVNQLLDEVGNNTDQLPVLQHSLMRTWDYWALQNDQEKPINGGDYEAIGRMEKALSDHANEAYDELDEEQRVICENLFKTITEKGGDNRGVRRPSKISRIADIIATDPSEIIRVAEVFRSKGRTFLTPFQPVPLTANTVIDISHESLMRIWDRLRFWVDEEASSVQMYMKLSEASRLFQEGVGGLWRPPDLQLALNWRDSQKPTATWAVQYNPAFERAMVYLDTSETEFKKEEENKVRLQRRRLRVTRMFSLVLGGIAVIAMGLFLWTRDLQSQAEARRIEAVEQTKLAKQNAEEARLQQQAAVAARDSADLARAEAEKQSEIAEARRKDAVSATELAKLRQEEAQQSAKKALEAQQLADQRAKEAEEAKILAQKNAEEAEQRRMLSIAQSMAVKSTQMRTDTLLKGLLAYQAYKFNDDYQGVSYDPDIFGALYSGMKYFKGSSYNVLQGHNSTVGSMIRDDNEIISASSEGKIIKWLPGETDYTLIMDNLPTIRKVLFGNPSLLCLTNRSIIRVSESNTDESSFEFPLFTIIDLYRTTVDNYIIVYTNKINLTSDYREEGDTFFETESRINVIDYESSTGTLLVALENGDILFWTNFNDGVGEPQKLVNEPSADWSKIKYFPEKNMVAAGVGNSQGAIYLYDINTGAEIISLRGHNAKITGIAFSGNGKLMASSSYDGSVCLWHLDDLNTLPIIFNDHNTWVTSIVFSSDDQYIISGDKIGNLRMLPSNINLLIGDYCNYLTRDLTENEWQTYVGPDIDYKPADCNK